MIERTVLACTVSLLALVWATTPAVAADASAGAAEEGAISLTEIIVTAQKREQRLNDVPMSISVVTGDQLQARGVSDVRDLVKVTPGFNYTEAAYSAPVYSMRGVGFYENTLGSKPTVSVYVDETPLPFSIVTRGASLDVERVEVLKGPQGTLFGENATGGAINFIAAKPTSDFEAGLDASYGRFESVDLGGFVSGPLGESARARLALRHQGGGDWQQSYTRSDRHGRKDETSGRLLLDWDATPDLTLRFNLNGYVDRGDVQAAQVIQINPLYAAGIARLPLLPSYPLAPRDGRAADWDPGRNFAKENTFIQGSVRADYQVGESLTLTSISAASRYDDNQLQDADGTALQNLSFRRKGRIDSISQELRLTAELGERGTLISGVNYARDDVRQRDIGFIAYETTAFQFTDIFGVPPFTVYQQFSTQKTVSKAIFANVDYNVLENLKVYAGARYTETKVDFSGCTADVDGTLGLGLGTLYNVLRGQFGLPPNPPVPVGGCLTSNAALQPGLVTSELDQDNISWRAGLDWKPSPGHLVYANISKGYKSGSFPLLSGSRDTQFAPVTQESLVAYEAGFKSAFADRTVQLNGAVFYYDYTDKQLKGRVLATPNIFGPLEALVNIPKSSITGAELQLSWLPVRGLTLNAGASYIDSKIKGAFSNYTAFGVIQNFEGEPFPWTPKWQVAADAEYRWAVADGLDGFAGASLTYQSKTNGGLGQLPILDIDAYALVDLRAGVETADKRWRGSIWVRNLTDEYYWSNAARTIDTTVRYAGMPRTFGVSVSYRFQ